MIFLKWNLFNVHNLLSFFCQPFATKLRYHKALKQQQANADSWCNWQQRQVIFCHRRRRFSDIDEIAYQNGERGQRVVTDYSRLIGTTLGVPVKNRRMLFWLLYSLLQDIRCCPLMYCQQIHGLLIEMGWNCRGPRVLSAFGPVIFVFVESRFLIHNLSV